MELNLMNLFYGHNYIVLSGLKIGSKPMSCKDNITQPNTECWVVESEIQTESCKDGIKNITKGLEMISEKQLSLPMR